MGTTSHPTAAKANQVRVAMQQKTDGRVVRLLTKYVGAEGRPIEQWFLVAIGDDDKPLARWQSQRMLRMQFLRSLDTSPPPPSPAGA